MKREQRLRTAAEFRRAREQAPRAWPHPLLVLYVVPNELGRTRVGITVSSRVGNAVVRNRVRRRLKAALQQRIGHLTPAMDLLFVARPASTRASWGELTLALDGVLARAGATARPVGDVQLEGNRAT